MESIHHHHHHHHAMVKNSPSINQSPSMNKHQPILAKKSVALSSMHQAPSATTSSSTSSMSSPELLRCKRRINFGGLGYALPQTQPATVARRNERERNRVKMVNLGFATLRQHVPNGAKNKKMSKVETLRSAVEYIRQLQQLLGEDDSSFQMDLNDQCQTNHQRESTSSDENFNPSPSTLSTSGTLQSSSSLNYTNVTSSNNALIMRTSSSSPISPMPANSPTSSMGSDVSSPYDSLDSMERQVSPEEEDLFDFANWFS